MKNDRVHLLQILESIRRIEDNTSTGHDAFMSTHTLQDAVLRNLHTMSESAQRLSPELKTKQSNIDWRLIGAFRNVLVHDYLGIDLGQVWEIIQINVPELRIAAAEMLSELPRED